MTHIRSALIALASLLVAMLSPVTAQAQEAAWSNPAVAAQGLQLTLASEGDLPVESAAQPKARRERSMRPVPALLLGCTCSLTRAMASRPWAASWALLLPPSSPSDGRRRLGWGS